jgi:hypothetical protein
MAVQKISGKHIIKRNENFKPIVNTNSYGIEHDYNVKSIYGEEHKADKKDLDMNELADLIADKVGFKDTRKTQAIDVDIKREIAIGKVDKHAVTSEVMLGTVKNKLEKLRALRKNGS